MLTVSVEDFGPIVAGTVDLKPLTIFMGRSNTGKSYMAAAIYALMTASYDDERALSHRAISLARQHRRAFRRSAGLRRSPDILEEVPAALLEWSKKVQDLGELNTSRFRVSDLPGQVQSALMSSIGQFLDSFSDNVIERLRQTYGETSAFVRRGKEPIGARLTILQDQPKLHLNIQLSGSGESMREFEISQVSVPPSAFEHLPFIDVLDEDEANSLLLGFFYQLEGSAIEQALGGLPPQSYYLPAARSGIAQGHKVLAASLVRQSRRIGLEPVNIPTLPGITTEFLSHIIGLDRRMRARPRQGALDDAINFVEHEVLHGRIDLDDSAGLPYPEIVYEQKGIDPSPGTFTLEHTSSMVSELAPLILFLRYLVTDADLLILEEPESHLHPGAQRQMARGIARLVNAGIRVIITTHSDMFIAQINNLLRLSHASKRWIREHEFEPQDCLRQHQIGAFLFHYDKTLGGNVINPLEINPETGIDEEEFVREIEVVYDEAIALQRIRTK